MAHTPLSSDSPPGSGIPTICVAVRILFHPFFPSACDYTSLNARDTSSGMLAITCVYQHRHRATHTSAHYCPLPKRRIHVPLESNGIEQICVEAGEACQPANVRDLIHFGYICSR
jgi:hypothetical protein